jgi:hypothetical protein
MLDDVVANGADQRDLLWSDAELSLWANEAISEAAVRTQGTRTSTTITFTQGVGRVPLAANIISVGENAVLASLPVPRRVHILREDDTDERWGTRQGTPTAVAYMHTPAELWLNAAPSTPTFDVVIDAAIIPDPIQLGDNIPLPIQQHTHLVYWVLHKAYMKHDAETEDMARSRQYGALFDKAFGQQQSFVQMGVTRDFTRQRSRASFF